MGLDKLPTSKQRRSVKHDLSLIFSSRGLTFPKSLKELGPLAMFSPHFEFEGRNIYFSRSGDNSIRRICTLVEQTALFRSQLSFHDIYGSVIKEIERWFKSNMVPDVSELLQAMERILRERIKTYEFMCKVEVRSMV